MEILSYSVYNEDVKSPTSLLHNRYGVCQAKIIHDPVNGCLHKSNVYEDCLYLHLKKLPHLITQTRQPIKQVIICKERFMVYCNDETNDSSKVFAL